MINQSQVKERYDLLRKEINAKYDILDLVQRYLPNATKRDIRIPSIINSADTNPSFNINYHKKVWNCFSSGFGGGYLELLFHLEKDREGQQITIYKLADRILKNDPELQRSLGFSTLFTIEIPKTLEISVIGSDIKPTRPKNAVKSFKELVDIFSKKDNQEFLLNLISDYETGMSEVELCSKYSGDKYKETDKSKEQEFRTLLTNLFG